MPKGNDSVKKTQKVIVCDVDGTIFRSSLLIELVDHLTQTGIFPTDAIKVYDNKQKAWLDRKGDYESYIIAVVKAFRAHIKGVPYGVFADAALQVIDEHQHRTYQYVPKLLRELKRKGYYLLAVSHSPKTILEPFCKRLGFDKVYGMIYEIGPEDCFTGKIIDEHLIMNKANIVKRAVEKEQLTLKNSIGVGDTEGDISFLELVEKPIAFNPNAKLYKYAKRMSWPVVVERKDVIYEL